MKITPMVVCLLIAAGVLIAACCDQVPIFPPGAYVARSTEGDYILDFQERGVYTALLAGHTEISTGKYQPTADTITFNATPPCVDEATYLWYRDEEKLTFEAIGEDSCPHRRAYLQDMVYTCVTCT